MKQFISGPGENPFLLDPFAFGTGGIPITPSPLDGTEAQVRALLKCPDDDPRDPVLSRHAGTEEVLISIDIETPDPTGPAVLLIGHDRPIFSPVILVGGSGSVRAPRSPDPVADRTAFLFEGALMVSSVFRGKRRWRSQPAWKYGADAPDVLGFLNAREDLDAP